jgi:hypothetical protein
MELRLLRLVPPKHSERHARILESCPCEQEFAPELVIHAEVIFFVEATDTEGELKWKDHRLLGYVSTRPPDRLEADEVLERMNPTSVREEDVAGLVDVHTVANVDDVVGKVTIREKIEERIPAEQVVAVNPGGVSTGPDAQSPIDRSTLAAVWFAHPEIDPGRILLDDLDGVVSACPIQHEVLEIWIALEKNRSDRLLDERSLVEGRRDDRDPRARIAR